LQALIYVLETSRAATVNRRGGGDAPMTPFCFTHPPLVPCPKQALIYVLETSRAATIMGLQKDLEEAAATLKRYNLTNISLAAGCEMFVRNMARIPDDKDFAAFKAKVMST
jgi:hypothetical protein